MISAGLFKGFLKHGKIQKLLKPPKDYEPAAEKDIDLPDHEGRKVHVGSPKDVENKRIALRCGEDKPVNTAYGSIANFLDPGLIGVKIICQKR
jgi:hypothetical protein